MKPATGHQVNGTLEEFRQLVRETLDVPAEPRAWLELVEQINVAAWSGLPPSRRAEDLNASDAVAAADLRKPLQVQSKFDLGVIHDDRPRSLGRTTGYPQSA